MCIKVIEINKVIANDQFSFLFLSGCFDCSEPKPEFGL